MKAVVQRVSSAKVEVEEKIAGEIDRGFLVLLGVENGDTGDMCEYLAKKVSGLRIFEDENGKMNLSLADVGGKILAISNFTLCADCKKGYRPSFVNAAPPKEAKRPLRAFLRVLPRARNSRRNRNIQSRYEGQSFKRRTGDYYS